VWSFISFALGALLPLLPWFAGSGTAATWTSLVLGVTAAAVVGGLIGRFAERSISRSALRQVVILLLACGTTYLIGSLVGTNID
jgi:VIT1/CCC1 family predicted Fe2+/Mn2+ transporter